MGDIRDILGIKRDESAPAPKPAPKATEKKPKGVSREVWLLGGGTNADSPPIVPTSAVGLKEKRKSAQKVKVSWRWKPFTNSARQDSLQLKHWVKIGGSTNAGTNGGDVGGDYAFAKYNKKMEVLMYNDEEYASFLDTDPDWTREETDHLFDLLQRFDLRFIIVHDRYDFPGRTVEDLKSRYYSIAKKLLESRATVPEELAQHPIVKEPFNAPHETERKRVLGLLIARTPGLERDEAMLLEKAKEVAVARKARGVPLHSAPPPPVTGTGLSIRIPEDAPALAAPAAGLPAAGAAAGAVPAEGAVRAPPPPEIQFSGVTLSLRPPGGGPAAKPEPGVYLRGKYTITTGNSVALLGSNVPRLAKRVDGLLDELGVKGLTTPTHATCRTFLTLRQEAARLLHLRKQLSNRLEGVPGNTPPGAGGPASPGPSIGASPRLAAAAAAAATTNPAKAALTPTAVTPGADAAATGGAGPGYTYAPASAGAVGAAAVSSGITPKGQRSSRVVGMEAVTPQGTPPPERLEPMGSPGTGSDPRQSNKRGGLKRKVPAPARFEDSPPRKTDKRPRVGRKSGE